MPLQQHDTRRGSENRHEDVLFLYLELAVMIHSWRLVVFRRYNQLPLSKVFLAVGVREFVPGI